LNLSNTAFIGNSPGGVFVRYSSQVFVDNGYFERNSTPNYGGGLWSYDSPVTVVNTTFISNAAASGGGLFAISPTQVTNTKFLSNSAQMNGGGAFFGDAKIYGSRFEGNSVSDPLDGGGAIYTFGLLNIGDTQFINNQAQHDGGAVYAGNALAVTNTQFISNSSGASGGGIYARDVVTLTNVELISNTADGGAGAFVRGIATVSDSRFEGNAAQSSYYAGGLYGYALYLTNTQFISNSSGHAGAAQAGFASVYRSRFERNTSRGFGGALAVSDLVMNNTLLISNTSGGGGAGAWVPGNATITDGRFENNQALGTNPEWSNGGGLQAEFGTVSISGTQFIGNSAMTNGGGLSAGSSAVLTNVKFVSNTANWSGGGAYFSGTVSLANTHFVSNTAGQYGGGAEVLAASTLTAAHFLSNTAYYGGGLYAHYTTTLTNSEFSYNSATFGGGVLADRTVWASGGQFVHNYCFGPACSGGAIVVATPSNEQANLILAGVRFIANAAPMTDSVGGAVCYNGHGALYIENTLFARNAAPQYGAALFVGAGQVANLHHLTISDVPTNTIAAVTIFGNLPVSFVNSIVVNHAIGLQRLSARVEDYNLYHGNIVNLTGMSMGAHDRWVIRDY
jgi:predicted outer membrane repeat protein